MKVASIDPGKNSGATIGYVDAITPYRLLERFQIHGGAEGFAQWLEEGHLADVDVIICERFVLANNEFVADITPKEIEGLLIGAQRFGSGIVADVDIVWQTREDKAALVGAYPASVNTPAKRQRYRFDFLERFGLFKPGTENDDSNDTICHVLVYLKRVKHGPSMMAFWPPRLRAVDGVN